MNDYDRLRDAQRTPIIKLWDLLLVPLQGEVGDRQAQMLTEEVLWRIQRTGARGMVVDLSGMWMVDSHLCAVLARLAHSAKLMGTRTVISGMNPDVALTLQAMGVEMSNVESALGLEEAIELLNGLDFTPAHERAQSEEDAIVESLLGPGPAVAPERKANQ